MLDRSFQRKVLELKVRCSKKNDGCQWAGELRHAVIGTLIMDIIVEYKNQKIN